MTRDYKKEYAEYHSKPEQKKNRAMRNKAHRNSNCGPGQEVDHKVPLSAGGSNSPSNWRVVSKETNRKKGSKKMSSFERLEIAIQNSTIEKTAISRLPSLPELAIATTIIGGLSIPAGIALHNYEQDKLKKERIQKLKYLGGGLAATALAGYGANKLIKKTAAPEGVERLPSGAIKYRDETFPGYNKPKTAPAGSKHKKRVLAKKGDEVKVVNFGARGYKHNYSPEAKRNYLARSAGIKGKDDKFSANYWSRRELWPKNQKADGSAKKAAAKFDAATYYASLSPEQRQSMQDAVNASMLGITKEMNKEMEPLNKELQQLYAPYHDRLKSITDKYNPRLQKALIEGYRKGGASDEYLNYLKNQQADFTYMGKIASADDNFNTSYLESFMSSASND